MKRKFEDEEPSVSTIKVAGKGQVTVSPYSTSRAQVASARQPHSMSATSVATLAPTSSSTLLISPRKRIRTNAASPQPKSLGTDSKSTSTPLSSSALPPSNDIYAWTLKAEATAPCLVRDVYTMKESGVKGAFLGTFLPPCPLWLMPLARP
jgi:hypothetical protein